MSDAPDRSATYFDEWYADMVTSPRKDEIEQRHLGLPSHLLSTSLLTWAGIAEVTAMLDLQAGETLLDLACGRGGYGLEIARRTDTHLIGVDFSKEALRQARLSAAELDAEATFVEGELAATGLPSATIDAAMCIDAIQFADPPAPAYAEAHRVLRTGGRFVLTTWEPTDPRDERLSNRMSQVDVQAGLRDAGFTDIVVTERQDWRDIERSMWEEAAALDPGNDPAMQSLHAEGVRSLAAWDSLKRILACARRP